MVTISGELVNVGFVKGRVGIRRVAAGIAAALALDNPTFT
jgi:hypothetical protein